MNLSLYLHFPFCSNHCAYCDFYKLSHVPEIERQFYDALLIETELAARKLGDSFKEIDTLFIGGGTPSLTNLDYFHKWLKKIKTFFHLPDGIEFSMEANPESVSLEFLTSLKDAGVTRPTFGIQSFDKKTLTVLGRNHNPHDSHRAVYHTNLAKYSTFGVDQIFGIPNQTGKQLSVDIDQLLDLEPPHISFYQLTLEEGTRLTQQVAAGEYRMPDEELLGAMYQSGVAKFREAGYVRYEISSFAKPGHECRHNISYWSGNNYLGLGPAAHSYINGSRFYNPSDLGKYVSSLQSGNLPSIFDDSGQPQRMTEAVYLGLRTMWGVDRSAFIERFEQPLDSFLRLDQLELGVKAGHITDDGKKIILTDSGMLVADELSRLLLQN